MEIPLKTGALRVSLSPFYEIELHYGILLPYDPRRCIILIQERVKTVSI